MMPVQEGGWPWRPELCPADADFLKWFKDIPTAIVFQMGPGEHHSVGRLLAEQGSVCLAVTISVEEQLAYTRWAIENPHVARWYQCLFADVQNISPILIPDNFDIVYLPHLGEMPDVRRDAYALSIQETLELFVHKLAKRGRVVLYNRSAGHGDILPQREWLARNEEFDLEETFATMEIWRKR